MNQTLEKDSGQRFHFISGLPRSGTTLLAAILRQNPRFHAHMTSPVGSLFNGVVQQFSAGSEYASLADNARREAVLRGLFSSYYQDYSHKEVIFDTNRLWCSKLPALSELFPESKVVCGVRNVAWIMDSLERQFRNHPFENTRLFNNDTERNTVYARVETLAQRNRLVGFAWSALKEAFYSEQGGMLLLIDYELLAKAPEKIVPLIYQFLGEEPFDHNYSNVEFDAPDFDADLGISGLHRVRRKVTFKPRNTILPPDLFEKYASLSFWTDQTGSRANVITVPETENSGGGPA